MKRIRIKKEIALVWAVTTNGHEEPLAGRNLSLFLVDPKYRKTAKTFHIENGNEVHFRVYPSEQPFTGVYTLELWENLGGQDQTVVDKRSAFELVNYTPQECDGSVDDIHAAEVFIGSGNLAVGIHGRGIVSVTKVSEDPNDWDYRILYDDGATEIIKIARGEKGLTDEEQAELIAETLAAKSAAQSANLAATLAASKAAEAAEAAQTATNAAEVANAAKEAADAATEAAQEATTAANAAKTAANNAATLANNAAANANTKAALAQAAADATNAAIAAASTATAAANAATAAANTAAEAANTAAATANSAASNASAKATLANDAAAAAQAAKDAAMAAKNAADTAAQAANEAATAAQEAAQTIDAKIGDTRNRVLDVEKDFGKYVQRPDVTLEVVQTGKRFTKDGEMVADANWNIGRIGSVERGLLYELFMGGSAKMVLGTALFVSHTIEKRGTQDVDIYTPVFSALGTDLPVSNYAVLWAGENYTDLLVSYRADVAGANVMRVAEWGLFKSIATQYSNLDARVDLKSFADGYYEGMRVGVANNLATKGEPTEETFMERVVGGTNSVEDGSASIHRIKGKTLKVVQIVTNPSFDNGAVSWNIVNKSEDGNRISFSSASTAISAIKGHVYAVILNCSGSGLWYQYIGSVSAQGAYKSLRPTAESAFYFSTITASEQLTTFGFISEGGTGTISINKDSGVRVFDLTAMFGAGNEPATPQAFAEAIGYPSIDAVPYVPYTEGKLIPSKVEGVKTTGRNLWDEQWENGHIDVNGNYSKDYSRIRSANFIQVDPRFQYKITTNLILIVICYDKDFNMIPKGEYTWTYAPRVSSSNLYNTISLPSNCRYIRFSTDEVCPTYKHDICINISDASFDGQYEPYEAHERKWTDTIRKYFPDGLKRVGDVYDEITPTKAIKRVGAVDLGSLTWNKLTTAEGASNPYRFIAQNTQINIGGETTTINCEADKYSGIAYSVSSVLGLLSGNFDMVASTEKRGYINVVDTAKNAMTPAEFKAAMQGVMLYYELAEPEVYEYDELNLTEIVVAGGKEIAIVPEGVESAPLVADIAYPIDAYNTIVANKAKIEALQQKPAISLTADEVTKLRALISTATQSEGGEL